MTHKQLIKSFSLFGQWLQKPDGQLTNFIQSASNYNPWFTPENTLKAITAFGEMLTENDLQKWVLSWDMELTSQNEEITNLKNQSLKPKKIGLVMAGNIPMVGLHDILCVLASGNIALIKLSSQDQKLIPYVLQKLIEIEPNFKNQLVFVDRLKDFEAVIATGSNNTSRYFEYYFSKVPHIIRKNRNSIAILTGFETSNQLKALGNDIFDFFGLGCRNVSKLYVPDGYNFNLFFESIEEYKTIADHHKYNNNYDYNKSIFLVNMDKHLDNGFLLLKNDTRIASPLAVLYFEEYLDKNSLNQIIGPLENQIQCVVTGSEITLFNHQVDFGQSQHPKLWDYADNVNTMEFLHNI